MPIFRNLFLLFVIVPIVELALLVQMGRWLGLIPTLALVFFTGALGAWLARAEGLRVLWSARTELASGRLPGQALMDGVSILVGGAVLLTPGLLTDLFGFALLWPPTRRALQRGVRSRLERRLRDGSLQIISIERHP